MVLGSSPVAVTSPSDFAPASSKEFLDIQATIECGFTLKRVRDMTRTYSLYIPHVGMKKMTQSLFLALNLNVRVSAGKAKLIEMSEIIQSFRRCQFSRFF